MWKEGKDFWGHSPDATRNWLFVSGSFHDNGVYICILKDLAICFLNKSIWTLTKCRYLSIKTFWWKSTTCRLSYTNVKNPLKFVAHGRVIQMTAATAILEGLDTLIKTVQGMVNRTPVSLLSLLWICSIKSR